METVQRHSVQAKTCKSVTKIWELNKWNELHGVLTKTDSCEFKIGNNVLRFFLRPTNKQMITKDYAATMNFYALWVELIQGEKEFPFYLKWNLRILDGEKGDGKPADSFGSISNSVLRNQRLMVLEDFINMGTSLIRLNSVGSYYFPPCTKANYFTDVQELEIEFCLSSLALTNNNLQPQSQEVHASLLHQRNIAMLNEHAHLFDVKLKLKDEVTPGAHKIILSASSPVFRAMFTSGMKESTENEVVIPDLSSDTMKIILHHIYTDEVNENWKQNVMEIVHAASKYGLGNLLEYLNTNFITVCTPENAVELFKLAKLHNLDKEMEQLTEYTRKNTADVLLGMRLD